MIELPILQRGKLVLLLGDVDTGKTTMCRQLAAEAAKNGLRVGVVDSDIGQSWIGPPTTVGAKVMNEAGAMEPADAIAFVGNISPENHIPDMLVALQRMIHQCRQLGSDLILVDTTGFVSTPTAIRLKQLKVDLIQPDDIVAIERGGELAPILAPYQNRQHPTIHRLRRQRGVSRKSAEARRHYRNERLRRYFHDAQVRVLNWSTIRIQNASFGQGRIALASELDYLSTLIDLPVLYTEWPQHGLILITEQDLDTSQMQQLRARLSRRHITQQPPTVYDRRLVGIIDACSDTIGLGLIESIQWNEAKLCLRTPVTCDQIHTLKIGVYHWSPDDVV